MNKKTVASFFTGIVFTVVIIIVIVSCSHFAGANENVQDADSLPDYYQVYAQSLIGPFQDEQSEIQDPDISEYYGKLMAEYNLEQVAQGISQTDSSDPSIPLPDIEKIQYAALTFPLREAGKKITDEQLLEFYNRFLKSCGWDVSAQTAGE
jgi:hypothetical protein